MIRPLISIVLPTFNGARYIAESIASCREQTYPRWELIVVDDGSMDATPEIVAAFQQQDSRIRTIRQPRNLGLPPALNTGFRASLGDYLTWTSDDNRFRPPALERMVSFLESHPEIGFVYTDLMRVDEQGAPVARFSVGDPQLLALGNCMSACFLYRRAVYAEVGDYAEDLFCAEDYDYWMRVSAVARMQPLHEDLYLYRHHARSLSSTRNRRIRLAMEVALRRNLPRMRWLSPGLRARGYLRIADLVCERGDQAALRSYFFSALRSSPAAVLRCTPPGLALRALMGSRCAHAFQTLRRRLRGSQLE